VKQAVAKVVSMFNPAGAIIQAIIAIYNVVMFVIEKAQQIMTLVEAVINSVHAIATGAIGGAIAWIEKSLAAAIPVVIGFLARLLGLSGITEKIQGFIKKVQAKVDAAIDKVIAKIVGVVKKLFGAVKAGAKKLIQWWKKKEPINAPDERHTLLFTGSGASAKLVMRSAEIDPLAFLTARRDRMKPATMTPEQKKDYDDGCAALATAGTTVTAIHGLQKDLKDIDDPKSSKYNETKAQAKSDALNALLKSLAVTIAQIIGWFRMKDGKVAKFTIPSRRSWSIDTLREIAAAHLASSYARPGDLKKVKGEALPILLNKGRKLGRRHIVSSNDMAGHYMKKLIGNPMSKGRLLLEQSGSNPEARVKVAAADQPSVEQAAKDRHAKFFNYANNLWVGNQRRNSELQARLDKERPDMAGDAAAVKAHVAHIKRAWTLDGDFTPST